MKPIRIAHLSDTHLGYRAVPQRDHASGRNQRSVDVEDAFHFVVSDILQRDVDLVIHSGDLFHQSKPSYAAQRSAIREFRRLEQAGLEIAVIGGNHDTPRLRTTSSVFSVIEMALERTRFVCGYEEADYLLRELDARIVAIPHGRLVNPIRPDAYPTPGLHNVMISHGFVPGLDLPAARHEPGEEEIFDELLDDRFEYIALGHYHVSSHPRPNAWYAGATERYGWGDRDVEPGYLLVDLGETGTAPTVEHIAIPARPMLLLPAIAAADRTASDIVAEIIEQLELRAEPAAMVRVDLVDTNRTIRRETEALLRKQATHLAWWIEVRLRNLSPLLDCDRLEASGASDLATLFDQFIAQELQDQTIDADFAREFAQVGKAELGKAMTDALNSDAEQGITS